MEINKWHSIEEAEKELREKATYRLNGKTKAASFDGFNFSFKDNGLWITWPGGIDKTLVQGNDVFKLTSDQKVVRGVDEWSDSFINLMKGQPLVFASPFPRGYTTDLVDSALNPGSTCGVDTEVAKHLNDFGKELGQKPPKKERFEFKIRPVDFGSPYPKGVTISYFYTEK